MFKGTPEVAQARRDALRACFRALGSNGKPLDQKGHMVRLAGPPSCDCGSGHPKTAFRSGRLQCLKCEIRDLNRGVTP